MPFAEPCTSLYERTSFLQPKTKDVGEGEVKFGEAGVDELGSASDLLNTLVDIVVTRGRVVVSKS